MKNVRIGVATIGLLLSGSCALGDEPAARLGEVEQPIMFGTVDSGASPKFPSVVRVALLYAGSLGTGTLVSPQVVVTAGHTITGFATGCTGYGYDPTQPAKVQVWVADANGNSNTAPSVPGNVYNVDAVATQHRYAPANWYQCCGPGVPQSSCPNSCALTPNQQTSNIDLPFDVALLHLDRPVQGVTPWRFVARSVPNPWPDEYEFDVDVADWAANDLVVSTAGFGGTSINGPNGVRYYGPMAITALAGQFNPAQPCDGTTTTTVTYTDGFFNVSGVGVPNGVVRIGGDSGAPIVANFTGPNGIPGVEAVTGLPANEPVIVGFGSMTWGPPYVDIAPASWDADTGTGKNTEMGTYMFERLYDWDRDGVPDTDDNCPLAPNPEQRNCNAAAEQAHSFAERGDACDPVPCADYDEALPDVVVVQSGGGGGSLVSWWSGRYIYDDLVVEPRGSNYAYSGSQNNEVMTEQSMGQVTTRYRYCQPNSDKGVSCNNAIAMLNAHIDPESATLDPNHPWLHAHLKPTSGPAVDSEPLYHPTTPPYYPRQWQYWTDFLAWAQSGKLALPDSSICTPTEGCCTIANGCCPAKYGCGTNLDGRMLIRSDTTKGTNADPAISPSYDILLPANTGYHPLIATGAPDATDIELSNHHADLAPDKGFSWFTGVLADALPHHILYMPWPPEELVDPWNGFKGETSYVLSTADGGFGLLRGDRVALLVTELLGSNLRVLLAQSDRVWATPAERLLTVARSGPNAGFHAIVFSADGSDIADGVLRNGSSLGSTADFSAPSPARPGTVPARRDFIGVFSRSLDRAFILGGRSLSTGQLLHDIWLRPVDRAGAWRQTPLGSFALGTIRSAIWSYVDRRLWVLDEVSDTSGTSARLLRIEPNTGAVQVVGTWTRHTSYDQHWLGLDLDGQVLLTASSTSLGRHIVARFEGVPYQVDVAPRTSMATFGGALRLAPIADVAGYSFAIQEGTTAPLLQRASTLGLTACSLAQVGDLF